MKANLIKALMVSLFCVIAILGCSSGNSDDSASSKTGEKTAVSGEPIVLVADGKCNMPIVVFEGAPPYVKRAADELAEYIQKISGVKPEVIHGEPKDDLQGAIWIGVQPKVKELFPKIDFDFKNPEEILISINDKNIVIAGRDVWNEKYLVVESKRNKVEGRQQEYGTVNAVYTFLQDFLGVRWLWPGDLGEDVIKKGVISLAQTTYRYHPQMRSRSGMFNYSGLFKGGYGRSCEWTKFQRLQLDSLEISGGHGFGNWWDRFHETHPEYFAMQPDGTRSGFPGPRTAKMCMSNPAVAEQWVLDVEEQLKHDPNMRVFNASPNDGWSSGHCVCEKCRAWDSPEGAPRLFHWQGLAQQYVALSDRDVTFANRCGKLLKKKFPDKNYYVLMLSYGHSRPAPVKAVPDDNVIILSVANFFGRDGLVDRGSILRKTYKEQFLAWADIVPHIMWRPNTGSPAGWQQGLLDVSIDQTIKDFKLIAEKKCLGIYIDGVWEHWATVGPQYYVMAQLAWDASKDGYALLDDYYARGFDVAADDIKAYWKFAGDVRETYVKGKKKYWEVYDKAFFDKANAFLDSADKKLAGKPEIYLKRVNFFRVGLEYSRLTISNYELMNKYMKSKKTDTASADQVRENWKVIEKLVADNPYTINWGPVRPITPRMKGLHPDYLGPRKKKK